MVVRVLEPADVPLVDAMSDALTPNSLYLRFFAGTPRIPTALLRQLAALDHDTREAVLAVADGKAVGMAQYVRDPDGTASAEIAVLVADAWQRQGIATALVSHLTELAVARGITRFDAAVLPENEAAHLGIARRWPGALGTATEDGIDYRLPVAARRPPRESPAQARECRVRIAE
ncbi:GNAT family N-acetyltransferase [Prauserella shujinwangii]|uniref:GNAT family N-acetyltransferase n=1 Tax=Prauserella shujinwangii TaxID=1453103 RepID=UPI001FE6240E|nr:GNAT family N-acetyltransferase [Prauserella shujinwangii]